MININTLNKIVRFGDEYRNTYIYEKYEINSVKNNWWEALLFFFDRAYYQGRKDIRQKIVNICNENKLSSLKFNQGAWFMGYQSFDILLKNTEKIE